MAFITVGILLIMFAGIAIPGVYTEQKNVAGWLHVSVI